MRIEPATLVAGAIILGALTWAAGQLLAAPPRAELDAREERASAPLPDAAALRAVAARLAPPARENAPGPVAEPVPAAPDIRLIGLVRSDTGWMALLSFAGETVTARPGERVRDYTLAGIDERSVVVEREGARVRLELES